MPGTGDTNEPAGCPLIGMRAACHPRETKAEFSRPARRAGRPVRWPAAGIS